MCRSVLGSESARPALANNCFSRSCRGPVVDRGIKLICRGKVSKARARRYGSKAKWIRVKFNSPVCVRVTTTLSTFPSTNWRLFLHFSAHRCAACQRAAVIVPTPTTRILDWKGTTLPRSLIMDFRQGWERIANTFNRCYRIKPWLTSSPFLMFVYLFLFHMLISLSPAPESNA